MKGINIGIQSQQKSYMASNQTGSHTYIGQIGQKQSTQQNSNVLFSKQNSNMWDVRRSLSTSWEESSGAPSQISGSNSMFSSTQSYGESLRTQRQQAKNTSLSLKKLKYQFKNLSTKILRSKTSLAAKQVAGQARREVLRLKSKKQSGDYDSEEIQAAIDHAKAMERVARKKARHLEEEEMAKCTGGPCAGSRIDEEEKLTGEDTKTVEENQKKLDNAEESMDPVQNEYAMTDPDLAMLQTYANCGTALDSLNEVLLSLDEFSDEILDQFSESMKDLFSEMGMDELADSLTSVQRDMDPADLKMMKIKHRNKEMKDMVKADAEYLKAVIDRLEKIKSGGVIPMNTGSLSFGSSDTMSAAEVAGVSAPAAAPMPAINVIC